MFNPWNQSVAVALACAVAWVAGGCGDSQSVPEPVAIQAQALNVGDPVRTVTLPDAIQCPAEDGSGFAHIAISVAAVPASDLGVSGLGDKPLLATSCRNHGQGNIIYFINPGSSDPTETNVVGTIAKQLTVDFTPPQGWGAFAFRGDVKPHDLIACSNPATDAQAHTIYTIDLSTGHASKLFDAAMPTTGKPFCDGLAWDPGDDTIYMSPDVAGTVYHYSPDGRPLNQVPVPPGCVGAPTPEGPSGNSGILVVGPDLLLACDGLGSIFRVNKRDGSVIHTFDAATNLADRAEDMECDSKTFGPDLSVAWTKDAFFPRFFSFVVPPGTCGLCRPTARRDLNNDLTSAERTLLAQLELDYLTGGNLSGAQRGAVVAEHRVAINAWHGAPQFFPGHRGYIGEFELFLLNAGHPEFVPLPKWNPANPVPEEFGGASGAGGTDVQACVASWTQLPPVTPGATACTTAPCTRTSTVAVCAGSPTTGVSAPLPSEFVFDFPGGPKCSAFSDIEAVRTGGFEDSYHGSQVHCGVFSGSSTMCDVRVSPSSPIFLPWHAFVDDVAYDYECKCKGSCSVCTDLFTPFMAGTQAPSPRAATAAAQPPPSLPNIGFWCWFEDDVVPPDLTRRFVTDHSPFFLRGEVHGRPNLMPGLVGQAIDLDGKDDFVEADDRTAGEVDTSNFTLDGWVKTSASGLQPIVSKVGHGHGQGGYALFLKDGQLGLFFGTRHHQDVFLATGQASIVDGAWHHVAAVVDREYATRSKLFVDGQVVLAFDATPFTGDATSHAQLRIGQLDVPDLFSHHHRGRAFFKGQLDELDLIRSALPPDLVASVFAAGSAGKFGSLGNLPTSAGGPPCIDALAQRIAALPPADAAPLQALYNQLLAALAAGNRGRARQLAGQIGEQADARFDGSYMTTRFHAVHHLVEACLDVPPLSGRR